MRRPPQQSRAGSVPGSPIGRPAGPPVSGQPKGAPKKGRSTPVRIMQGFFAGLPPPGVMFFDRTFERPFPKPLQILQDSSWQAGYDIWSYDLPAQRTLIIRDLSWTAFRNDNIGVGTSTPVAPGALAESLGFQFLIGDRWTLDIKNNNQGAGSPIVQQGLQFLGNGGVSVRETSVNGRTDPTGAPFSGRYGTASSFAMYAQGGQKLTSRFYAFRQPPVEVTKVQFNLNGWLVPKALWTNMLESGEWGLDNLRR